MEPPNIAEVVAGLPDDVEFQIVLGPLTKRELKAAIAKEAGKAYLTTDEASERFGFSNYYWMDFARECEDAVKGRRWLIPASACELHMRERSNRRKRSRGRPRGGRPRTKVKMKRLQTAERLILEDEGTPWEELRKRIAEESSLTEQEVEDVRRKTDLDG